MAASRSLGMLSHVVHASLVASCCLQRVPGCSICSAPSLLQLLGQRCHDAPQMSSGDVCRKFWPASLAMTLKRPCARLAMHIVCTSLALFLQGRLALSLSGFSGILALGRNASTACCCCRTAGPNPSRQLRPGPVRCRAFCV